MLGRTLYVANRLKSRVRHLTARFMQDGIEGLLNGVVHHLLWTREVNRRDAAFDQPLGVDTAGPVGLWRLRIDSKNLAEAVRYEGVNPTIFRRALGELGRNCVGYTFVDLGCGKGRALLLAREFGFAKLVGVEFAAELADIARKNCQSAGIDATVLCQDAAEFRFPAGDVVVYLYNPFGPSVLNASLEHLLESRAGNCFVVYNNPVHRRCLDERPKLRYVAGNSDYGIWCLRTDQHAVLADCVSRRMRFPWNSLVIQ